MAERVTICEMSPRDGMQVINRSSRIGFDMRLSLLQALQRGNFPYIEAGSFVSPKVLPQLGDTPELLRQAKLPNYGGQLAALVPNAKFYERFKDTANLTTVALFLSASEEYSQKNKRISIADDLADARQVARQARAQGHRLRAHLSGAFRGLTADNKPSDADLVARMCRELIDFGCQTVALADTDGRATPQDIHRVISRAASESDMARLGVHLHDRLGLAIANTWEAYRLGVRTFDGAVGGIGGAKALASAVGNVATEELVIFFASMGVETGIELGALREAMLIIDAMAQLVGDPRPASLRLLDELARL